MKPCVGPAEFPRFDADPKRIYVLEFQSGSPFFGVSHTREGRSRLHGVTWG